MSRAPCAIRAGGAADLATLVRLNAVVQGLHAASRPDRFRAADPGAIAAWFRERLDEGGTRAWLAEIEGEAVGYALVFEKKRAASPFQEASRRWELDQIAVDPAARSRGVATALIRQVLESARAEGSEGVDLSVWDFNAEARRVFAAAGFRPEWRRLAVDFDGEGGDGSRDAGAAW